MNTPNPLLPQGSLQASQSKSTFRNAALAVIALHVVVFGAILSQSGCKREDAATLQTNPDTTPPRSGIESTPSTNAFYEPLPETLAPATVATTGFPETNLGNLNAGSPQNVPLPYTPPVLSQPSFEAPLPSAAGMKDYTIARGDLLANIAKANGVTLGELQAANPGVDARRLQIGKTLKIPASSRTTISGLGMAEPVGGGWNETVHVVKAGENLTRIAREHGVTVQAIKTANNLKTDGIRVKQSLKIPTKAAAPAPAPFPAASSGPSTNAFN